MEQFQQSFRYATALVHFIFFYNFLHPASPQPPSSPHRLGSVNHYPSSNRVVAELERESEDRLGTPPTAAQSPSPYFAKVNKTPIFKWTIAMPN
jgi:hypothetical protein